MPLCLRLIRRHSVVRNERWLTHGLMFSPLDVGELVSKKWGFRRISFKPTDFRVSTRLESKLLLEFPLIGSKRYILTETLAFLLASSISLSLRQVAAGSSTACSVSGCRCPSIFFEIRAFPAPRLFPICLCASVSVLE